MNIVKYFVMLFCLLFLQTNIILPTVQSQPCTQVAPVIFSQHLAKANIPATSKAQLQQILNNLYLGYLVRQNGVEVFGRSGTDPKTIDSYWQALKNGTANYDTNPFCLYTALKQNPQDIQDNKICIDTASLQSQPVNVAYCQQNLKNMYEACGGYQLILKDFLQQLDSKTFQSIPGQEQWQTNYVTYHLQKAVARLAATSAMVCNGMSCTPQFTGDVRDRGIIVNVQNNTQKSFAIIQSTVNGQDAKQIGMIKPGLNNVNLHLAALQAPNATAQTLSAYKFDVVAMDNNASANDQFSIKIMTGTEVLAFLKSINKNPKGLFYMNGRLIAPKYAVYPEGQFLVLMKMPKDQTSAMAYDKTADQAFPIDQRIQCIALNESNPYLMTMQINEDEVEFEATKDAKEKSKATILQPSFFSMQSLPGLAQTTSTSANSTQQSSSKQNPSNKKSTIQPTLTNSLSPIILPDFLADNQNLNVYTTVLQAAYIAALTDFAFFNQKCFANDMMCYDLLGYFDKKNQRRIVLNTFALYLHKKEERKIRNIIESVAFETNRQNYYDIPALKLSQGINGNIEPNLIELNSFNVQIIFSNGSVSTDVLNSSYIDSNMFGKIYKIPFQNDLFVRLAEKDLRENTFVYIDKLVENKYRVLFKNKSNLSLGLYSIYPSNMVDSIQVNFLDGNKLWVGSKVSQELMNLNSKEFSSFKIQYFYNATQKQHQLKTSSIRPIDKIKVIHTIRFFEYPIKNIYLDLFNIYEVSTIYRCELIKNGILPEFLQALSQDDWTRGIYMVTEVKNDQNLSLENLGNLTVTFYRSDGLTQLGAIALEGISDKTGKIGIIEPVHAYNLISSSFNTDFDVYLSTAIKFLYKSKAS